jgi:hypothetical protein
VYASGEPWFHASIYSLSNWRPLGVHVGLGIAGDGNARQMQWLS